MASRSLVFFMLPEEAARAVWTSVARHSLAVILRRLGPTASYEVATVPGTFQMQDGSQADQVHLALSQPKPAMLADGRAASGAPNGWAGFVSPPEVKRDFLCLADWGAKSDWWDRESACVRENPESLEVFKLVTPSFRSLLKRPVWANHQLTRNIWYSPGAAEWERRGGRLAQSSGRYTVGRVRFSTRGPIEGGEVERIEAP